MKKYWKNVKNTGKVYEKILEKCKKNWKSQGNSSVQKSGNHGSKSLFWNTVECLLSYVVYSINISAINYINDQPNTNADQI